MPCKHLTAACNWVIQTDTLGKIWHEIKATGTWKPGLAKTNRLAIKGVSQQDHDSSVLKCMSWCIREERQWERGGREGLRPRSSLHYRLHGTADGNQEIPFFSPSTAKTFPTASCPFCYEGSPSAQAPSKGLCPCCASSQLLFLPLLITEPKIPWPQHRWQVKPMQNKGNRARSCE